MTLEEVAATILYVIWGLQLVLFLCWGYSNALLKMLRQNRDIYFYLMKYPWKWRISSFNHADEMKLRRRMHDALHALNTPALKRRHMWLMLTFRDPIAAYPRWVQIAWGKQFMTEPKKPRPPLSNMDIIRKFEIGKLTFKQAAEMLDAAAYNALNTASLTRKQHS